MKARLLIPLLLLLWGSVAFAQEIPLPYSVKGVVRDSESGRPLQAVSVSVPGTNIAVITNSDGTFVIKTPTPAEVLDFSLMGYRRYRLTPPADPAKTMSVRMVRSGFTLEAATVMTGDPLDIMLYAMERINFNAPEKPELFDCFFRETVQKRQRYIQVSEAVTRVYKSPARDFLVPDRAAVLKSRNLVSQRASDTLGVKVLGGPAMAADLDIVKRRLLVVDPAELADYRLEMCVPEMIDDRMQFVIKLIPTGGKEYAQHHGTVWIDRETLAFTRIELQLDMSDRALATRAMLIREPAGLRFRPKEMSLTLNYRSEGGKSRLSYLRTCFRFECDWKKRLFATDYTAVAEMVVTDWHEVGKDMQIPRSEAFRSRDALSDKSAQYFDPDFWADYNIIEPNVSLEHALLRLKKDN